MLNAGTPSKLEEDDHTKNKVPARAADAHPDAGKLLLPALNQMIDITTTRRMATQLHPPPIIFVMLSDWLS